MGGDTRLWMYRKGEARLFEHPDHVPEGQDWQRFPAPVEGCENPQPSTAEKLDCLSRQRLMQVAAEWGVPFEFAWTKAQFKQAIIEVMNDNRA